jgi:ribonuclease T1
LHTYRRLRALVAPFVCLLFLCCTTGVAGVPSAIAAHLGESPSPGTTLNPSTETDDPAPAIIPPQKARDLLTQLQERGGTPLPGYIGGRDFQNRERRLPQGHYREYDVNPKIQGRSRDAERIVIERRTGKAYYTGDHYRTFIPLN